LQSGPAKIQGKAVHHDCCQKEKHDTDGELGRAGWRQRVLLQRLL